MLRIDKVTYQIGGRRLLDGAEAAIGPGQRVGMVGRNGTGKTTLLRLIAGQLETEAGAIRVPKRWRIGLTSQEAPDGPQSLIDTVLAADHELAALMAAAEDATDGNEIADIHARLDDRDAHTARPRAARILAGLGFDETAQQRPCGQFSGGWRMRVALASLLFTRPDLLLLDEPTNHLDLEATLWLEDYLRHYAGTVLLVSHDRDLLNRVPGHILHLEDERLTLYQGGYDRFEKTRRMRLELEGKQRQKQQAQRDHIQSYIDRFRYKASKAKQAQARIKMLARMEPIAARRDARAISFDFPEPTPLASPLLSTEGVAIGYDGKAVLAGLDLRLDGEDRIALLGANGNGKSTLIKLLAGRLAPLTGTVARSGKLRVGYFAQHQGDELEAAATPLIELGRRRPRDTDYQLRTHLGRFGFEQRRAETRIGALSGGEKARLLFALMSCDGPHVLLLDEPTNHLDVVAREALIQAINGFTGAVVIVSHDPHVLELTADRLWLVESGRVNAFDGDLEDYRARLLGTATGAKGGNKRAKSGNKRAGRGNKRAGGGNKRNPGKSAKTLTRRLARAEEAVHRLEVDKEKLITALADPALYRGDNPRRERLQKQLAEAQRAVERAEEVWLGLQQEVDALNP